MDGLAGKVGLEFGILFDHAFGVGFAFGTNACSQLGIAQRHDLRGEIGSIFCAALAYGNGCDGDAAQASATVESSESMPFSGPASSGTPMTGFRVAAETAPARWAARPAAAMNTAPAALIGVLHVSVGGIRECGVPEVIFTS